MPDSPCTKDGEPAGPCRLVCRCLQVTEDQVVRAITTFGLRTVEEVCRHTGAGGGCTCCRRLLGTYLPPADGTGGRCGKFA